MINWFDMPAEGLSNGGLFEVKELEVTENGTYETKGEMYNKVTVNVEGGGGSSDFSTAEVTIANTTTRDVYIYMPVQVDDEEEDFSALICNAYVTEGGTQTVTTVLYKGIVVAYLNDSEVFNVSVSGSAEYDSPNFDITGDCTITIS